MVSPETQRARELLAKGAELLENSRNRPLVEVRAWRSQSEQQAPAPIVHKTIEQPQPRGKMDPESSKAWNDWARSIARGEACKIGTEVMTLSDKGFKYLVDRIDHLEREIATLKGQPEPKLKAVGGRDA